MDLLSIFNIFFYILLVKCDIAISVNFQLMKNVVLEINYSDGHGIKTIHEDLTHRNPLVKYKPGMASFVAGRLILISDHLLNNSDYNYTNKATKSYSSRHKNLGCDFLQNIHYPMDWIALITSEDSQCTIEQKLYTILSENNAVGVIVLSESSVLQFQHNIFVDSTKTILIIDKLPISNALLYNSTVNINASIAINKFFIDGIISRTSVLLVSIAFILFMIISLVWLTFYYIQRFRYIHAKERLSRRLANAAKKALSKIPIKILGTDDIEITDDFDQCAICIDNYKMGESIRILPCKHIYHKSCIDSWLIEQRSCPMCKVDIIKACSDIPCRYLITNSDSPPPQSTSPESISQLYPINALSHHEASGIHRHHYITDGKSMALHHQRHYIASASFISPHKSYTSTSNTSQYQSIPYPCNANHSTKLYHSSIHNPLIVQHPIHHHNEDSYYQHNRQQHYNALQQDTFELISDLSDSLIQPINDVSEMYHSTNDVAATSTLPSSSSSSSTSVDAVVCCKATTSHAPRYLQRFSSVRADIPSNTPQIPYASRNQNQVNVCVLCHDNCMSRCLVDDTTHHRNIANYSPSIPANHNEEIAPISMDEDLTNQNRDNSGAIYKRCNRISCHHNRQHQPAQVCCRHCSILRCCCTAASLSSSLETAPPSNNMACCYNNNTDNNMHNHHDNVTPISINDDAVPLPCQYCSSSISISNYGDTHSSDPSCQVTHPSAIKVRIQPPQVQYHHNQDSGSAASSYSTSNNVTKNNNTIHPITINACSYKRIFLDDSFVDIPQEYQIDTEAYNTI